MPSTRACARWRWRCAWRATSLHGWDNLALPDDIERSRRCSTCVAAGDAGAGPRHRNLRGAAGRTALRPRRATAPRTPRPEQPSARARCRDVAVVGAGQGRGRGREDDVVAVPVEAGVAGQAGRRLALRHGQPASGWPWRIWRPLCVCRRARQPGAAVRRADVTRRCARAHRRPQPARSARPPMLWADQHRRKAGRGLDPRHRRVVWRRSRRASRTPVPGSPRRRARRQRAGAPSTGSRARGCRRNHAPAPDRAGRAPQRAGGRARPAARNGWRQQKTCGAVSTSAPPGAQQLCAGRGRGAGSSPWTHASRTTNPPPRKEA